MTVVGDDPRVRELLDRSMNMRVGTLSGGGVPHLTPLRFVHDGRAIYTLTRAASPVAGHVAQRPGVVLLFDAERTGPEAPVLRMRAQATIRDEPDLRRWYERRAAVKYFLRPTGIWNMLTHWRNLPTWLRRRRSATADDTMALIELVPETAELVAGPS